MLHPQMRVRLTTQVLPPWAVQDTTGAVMDIHLSARDSQRVESSSNSHLVAEMVLEELPHGVYVKLDKCNRNSCQPSNVRSMLYVACAKSVLRAGRLKVGYLCDLCADHGLLRTLSLDLLSRSSARSCRSCLKQHAPSIRCKGPHAIQG